MIRGGRNLVILGVVSILIAMMTTGISLAIYKLSGDIYLDRSVPGFLPDKEEIEEQPEEELDYEFSKSGPVTKEIISEFMDKFEIEVRALDSYSAPFDVDALSDKKLGIFE